MKLRKEYVLGGYIFGDFVCKSVKECPTTVRVKAPMDWMIEKGHWKGEPLSSKSEK
tara:strand:+ start:1574 stop:1741 length:168 start_codon:yes stop_codon:yes gene_type:complete